MKRIIILGATLLMAGCSNTAIVQKEGSFTITATGTVGFHSPERLIRESKEAYEEACVNPMSEDDSSSFVTQGSASQAKVETEFGKLIPGMKELVDLAKLGTSLLDILPKNTYNATFICPNGWTPPPKKDAEAGQIEVPPSGTVPMCVVCPK